MRNDISMCMYSRENEYLGKRNVSVYTKQRKKERVKMVREKVRNSSMSGAIEFGFSPCDSPFQ
jgi:hypothetical protein